MADHSKPTIGSTYVNYTAEIDARLDDLALGLDPSATSATGLPNGSIRWNSAAGRFQKLSGSNWNDLTALYQINISGNADTARQLQATHAINGVGFNGTASIQVDPYVEPGDGNGSYFPAFVESSSAGYRRMCTDVNWTYNPATNTLSVGSLSAGSLSGNGNAITGTAVGLAVGSAQGLTSSGAVHNDAWGSTRGPLGAKVFGVYGNGYPVIYGSVLHIGDVGAGQLLIGWSSQDGAHAGNYIRSKRDNDNGAWSPWAELVTSVNLGSMIAGAGVGIANAINSTDDDRTLGWPLPRTRPKQVAFQFANASAVGTGGNYAGVMTYSPWDGTTGSTGDASYQLAFGSTAVHGGGVPQLRLRKGIDSTWNGWIDIITSENIASYAPALPQRLAANRDNWAGSGAETSVFGQMTWNNYGNGHTILDASSGFAPNGAAIDRVNAQFAWDVARCPTLVGWNGSNTYGVRVDYARLADHAVKIAGGAAGSIPYQAANNETVFLPAGDAGRVLTSGGPAAAPVWSAVQRGGFSDMQVFAASGTWNVPAGVSKCRVTVIGGGGGGGSGWSDGNGNISGAGGAGGGSVVAIVAVTPGQAMPIVVGAGGAGGARNSGGGAPPTAGAGGTSSAMGVSAAGGGGSNNGSGPGGSGALGGAAGYVVTGGTGALGGLNVGPAAGGSTLLGNGASYTTPGGYGAGGSASQWYEGVGGRAGAPGVVIVEY